MNIDYLIGPVLVFVGVCIIILFYALFLTVRKEFREDQERISSLGETMKEKALQVFKDYDDANDRELSSLTLTQSGYRYETHIPTPFKRKIGSLLTQLMKEYSIKAKDKRHDAVFKRAFKSNLYVLIADSFQHKRTEKTE